MIDAVVSEHVNAPADRVRRCIGILTIGRASFPQRFAAPVSFAGRGTRQWSRLITLRGRS